MRSLRIGVVIAGQLVEERVFPATRPISLGQSLRCSLSIPVEGVPREHLLFARDEGAFVLHVAPNMTARGGVGDRVEAVTDSIRLAPGARGKLVLGDLTLLFQDVATVVRPKPQLPASLRARPFDRRLALIIGASLFVHIGIAAWAWNADTDLAVLGMRDIPSEFRQETIDVQLPDFETQTQTPTPTQTAVATPVAPQHRIVQPVRTLPSDPEQLARDASRMASILTGDDGSHGFGGMNRRQPGADLARQMDDAQNHTVTIGDNGHTSRNDGSARLGDGRDLHITQPDALVPADTVHERTGTARIVLQPLPGDGERTTLSPESVLDKIQTAYLPGLQRCYHLGQNEDATLEGKVRIELTVDEHGRVTDPAASGLTDKVDSCIQHFMSSWHFGIPRDKAGEPTETTFKIALVLKKS